MAEMTEYHGKRTREHRANLAAIGRGSTLRTGNILVEGYDKAVLGIYAVNGGTATAGDIVYRA